MRKLIVSVIILYLSGCAEIVPEPFEPSTGHISTEPSIDQSNIPKLVQQAPVLPEPEAPVELEKYTVVVNEVPANELLFALARDAQINVDIDPRIAGVVTINAVEQTLPQLLDRIARQVDLRYEFQQDNLIITPDTPFFRSYRVNYLNMARDTINTVTISTQIASTSGGGTTTTSGGSGAGSSGGGAGGGNNSTTEVTSEATNHFWSNLVQNIRAIIGEGVESSGAGSEIGISDKVIPHPETGMLTVNASSKQHQLVQNLIDNIVNNAQRQVLIQTTIIEVSLNDQFQSGIDWSLVNQGGQAGFDFVSTTLTGVPVGTLSSFLVDYVDTNTSRDKVITASLRLLEEFGTVKVLSSPQIMALNNQTALLKVVDNIVYFEVEADTTQAQTTALTTVETTARTVPVGIVMSLTPQISENDSVILQIRPTISRINGFVEDPAIQLIAALNPDVNLANITVANQVPEIQVREMESVLRMYNGQVAVLGGLMVDESRDSDAMTPGLSRIPAAGEAFRSRTREYSKSELVIFLRPIIVRMPSIEEDLRQYKTFLERNTGKVSPAEPEVSMP